MNPIVFFLLALKASLFSTGGMGNVPILHDDLIDRRWATERHFAESLAVGQVAPGPNGLWVVSLGFLLDGIRGALLATVAICIPPLLVLVIDRVYRRVQDHPAVTGFMEGLSLAVIGVFAVVMMRLFLSSEVTVPGVVILLGSIGLGINKRVPVIAIVALAAIAGILWRG